MFSTCWVVGEDLMLKGMLTELCLPHGCHSFLSVLRTSKNALHFHDEGDSKMLLCLNLEVKFQLNQASKAIVAP